ncbi:hypothetical protein QNI11_01665 [Sagittula sp. MA-2]|nr:hypothetical protein [Sagittula sp. MA-2]WHZ35723.1 hypothetical protein QNI11_01665 [Sagittula sp. MA-2]
MGHDEEPFALVRRACFSRCEQASRRDEAQTPKVTQHGFEAEAKMSGDVLKEDPLQPVSEFVGDPADVGIEVALVVFSPALPGLAERLARISGKQGVDAAGKGAGVEGGEVVPDRRGGEVSGPLRGDDPFAGFWLPFDPASCVEVGFCEHEAHIEATGSSAEGQPVSGR